MPIAHILNNCDHFVHRETATTNILSYLSGCLICNPFLSIIMSSLKMLYQSSINRITLSPNVLADRFLSIIKHKPNVKEYLSNMISFGHEANLDFWGPFAYFNPKSNQIKHFTWIISRKEEHNDALYSKFTEHRDLCTIDNGVSIGNSFHSCTCDFASNEIYEILDEVERNKNIDEQFNYVDLTGM